VPGDPNLFTHTLLTAEAGLTRSLALGAGHLCVLYGANGVVCRGDNMFGQLGRYGPASESWVNVAFDQPIISLVSGQFANHTCARLANGEYRCWGDNSTGQLGVMPLLYSDAPVIIDP
jgi:alpha-tubulin suppressor-like RCC1 family protein